MTPSCTTKDQRPPKPSPKKYSPPSRNRPDVFRMLFWRMIAFGLLMGAAFPPLVKIYFNDASSISIGFTLMCMGAGITVGAANYLLFSLIISKQLRFLAEGMNLVNEQISAAMFSRQGHSGSYEIEVKTNDMIGEVTRAFNTMSRTVEQRLTHEASFREISSTLSANVDLDTTSTLILNYFIETSCITSGLIYGKIVDDMILLASHDVDTDEKLPRTLKTWQGIISDTIQSGEIHTIHVGSSGFDWISVTTPLGVLRPKFVRIIPLIANKSTVGLVIGTCGDCALSETLQQETLETYSGYMAPYLHNSLLHNKIQEMASYDSLTHVFNRRFGLIRLEEAFSAALRHHSELSTVILDIDNFKQVNDTYGHEAGDMVLKNVVSTITLNLRNEEIICRYGGEEFLIILPLANLNRAGLVAERLRLMVQEQSCFYKDTKIMVTISLGVSSLSALSSQNMNDLVNTADTALYHAKHMGRNQVAMYENDETVLLSREP